MHTAYPNFERGPFANARTQHATTFVSDPFGRSKRVPYTESLFLFECVQTESKGIVAINGNTPEDTATLNDYYGFGRSYKEHIEWAQAKHQEFLPLGGAADVRIETVLHRRLAILDDRTDVQEYTSGQFSLPVLLMPRAVYAHNENPKIAPYESLHADTTLYTIWQNGAYTPEYDALQSAIKTYTEEDCTLLLVETLRKMRHERTQPHSAN